VTGMAERIPDAPVVLLAGPGRGKLEALALAQAAHVVCRASHRAGDGGDACPDCRRARRGDHPDILVAAPESGRRLNTPPFEESSGSKETTLPTALVRAVAADATRLPYEARRRAIVLLDVDRTEAAAYSALLKILEEPPSKARFLLTATRPRVLPATILSRVALHVVPPLPRSATVSALRGRGLSEAEADARAAFFPTDADEAAALDLEASRALRDRILEAASGLFLTSSVSWALTLAAILAEDDAGEAASRLGLLAALLRDAAAATVDPAGHEVIHRERFADLARLGEAGPRMLLDAAEKALHLAADLDGPRLNVRLACEAWALGLAAATAGLHRT
jgi:DNA polymerase III delta prime subunit